MKTTNLGQFPYFTVEAELKPNKDVKGSVMLQVQSLSRGRNIESSKETGKETPSTQEWALI